MPDADALKVAVCEYLLQVNREADQWDAAGGRKFIPPTAIDWLGDGIVRVVLKVLLNDGSQIPGRAATSLDPIISAPPGRGTHNAGGGGDAGE